MEDITVRVAAEKALLRSNAELQRFAVVVSHDLQEPLRSVSGFTEILRRRYQGQLYGEADKLMQYVLDRVARMTPLIRDILAYSRAGGSGANS